MTLMSTKWRSYLALSCVVLEMKERLQDCGCYITGRLRDETMRHRLSKHKDLVTRTPCVAVFCFLFFSCIASFFESPLFSVTSQSISFIEAHGEDGVWLSERQEACAPSKMLIVS